MVITLTSDQQSRLLAWAGKITEDHINSDCEPPGYTLQIEVGVPWATEARAVCGSASIELGEVSMHLS